MCIGRLGRRGEATLQHGATYIPQWTVPCACTRFQQLQRWQPDLFLLCSSCVGMRDSRAVQAVLGGQWAGVRARQ
jgi:hypothetical protein